MMVTVTTYGPAAYLCRLGLLPGSLDLIDVTPRQPKVAEIQAATARRFGIPLAEMFSDRRHREVSRPRQISMYLARELTPRSLPQIGYMHGRRDHTTVMHAIRTIERLRTDDEQIDCAIREIKSALRHQVPENIEIQA